MKSSRYGDIASFCTHEHWGSINSIGMAAEGFRADVEPGAVPARRTGIWDLVLDPYLGGWVSATGVDVNVLAHDRGAADFLEWWERTPHEALAALRPHLERQEFTGAFQCIRRGVALLHGPDIATFRLDHWQEADASVAERYGDLFGWYATAMETLRFTEIVRPVHPEFYYGDWDGEEAVRERAFTRTILRIDPLLEMWGPESPRRKRLAERVGVEPVDPATWREFIGRLFDRAAACGTVGIKQLQAYSRRLEFAPREDADVKWGHTLSRAEVTAFQDWIVHECCRQAHDRRWIHQFHTGTHNLPHSNPLPLEPLARRYRAMKVVLIHCWPYFQESGGLAKHCENVYLDTCWLPVLNPRFLREALDGWLNHVPLHKIMCSHDATSVEMAAGSNLFTRAILEEAVDAQVRPLARDEGGAQRVARALLYDNAAALYGRRPVAAPVP